jgi:hypothetical protein
MELRSIPALALVLVLSALTSVAACSAIVGYQQIVRVDAPEDAAGVVPGDDDDDGGSPAPPDSGGPGLDSGSPRDAGDSGIPPASQTCPAPAPTSYPVYVSPPARSKPCTSADITTFVNNESRSFDMQKAAMAANNPACASCVFTVETDAVWGPIVHTLDDRIFDAFGLCYRVAGANDDCASKAEQLEWCLQKVCNVCTAGQNLNDCRDSQKQTTCQTYLTATQTACAPFDTIVNATCGGSGNVVGVMCGGS